MGVSHVCPTCGKRCRCANEDGPGVECAHKCRLLLQDIQRKLGIDTHTALRVQGVLEGRTVDVQAIAAIAWECIRTCKDYAGPPVMCPAHHERARAIANRAQSGA